MENWSPFYQLWYTFTNVENKIIRKVSFFFAWKPNQIRFENMLKFVIDKFAIIDRSKKSQFLTKLSSNYKLSMITKQKIIYKQKVLVLLK